MYFLQQKTKLLLSHFSNISLLPNPAFCEPCHDEILPALLGESCEISVPSSQVNMHTCTPLQHFIEPSEKSPWGASPLVQGLL